MKTPIKAVLASIAAWALIIGAVVVPLALSGCTTTSRAILPPQGSVVYCPHCDTNLYLRINGTSLTAFHRPDYMPLFFDIPLPEPGEEMVCPRCGKIMVDFVYTADADPDMRITKVYHRPFVERDEARITEILTEPVDGAADANWEDVR